MDDLNLMWWLIAFSATILSGIKLLWVLFGDHRTPDQKAFDRDAELLRQDDLKLNGFIR